MTGAQFITMLKIARDRQDVILKVKGDDYTIDQADTDRLYNFKAIGELLDLDPKQVLMVYLFKHLFSIAAYVKSKKESEPIDGRLDDAINYLYLLMGLIDEDLTKSPLKYGEVRTELMKQMDPDGGWVPNLMKKAEENLAKREEKLGL